MTWKIGLHNTAVGAFNGIEQYRDAIRAANIPIVCVQTDADNILRMMQENGRPEDILVYRRTGDLEQLPDNRGIPPPTRYIGHPESIKFLARLPERDQPDPDKVEQGRAVYDRIMQMRTIPVA